MWPLNGRQHEQRPWHDQALVVWSVTPGLVLQPSCLTQHARPAQKGGGEEWGALLWPVVVASNADELLLVLRPLVRAVIQDQGHILFALQSLQHSRHVYMHCQRVCVCVHVA